MKVLTNIIKLILIVILTLCMIAIGIITVVSSTILDKGYIMQKLEETKFYEETHELVKSNFENYIYQSGLDEVVLENICTQEKVKQDINIIISNIYEGTNQKIDTTEIAQNLSNNIEKLGAKNNKNEKAIEQFIEQICNEYTKTLIHTKYEDNINKTYIKINEKMQKAYNAIFIVFVIDAILIIALNVKKISKVIQQFGISTFSAGIFNLIGCNILVSKVNIAGIKIFNDSFSKTIVTILQEIIEKIFTLGIGTLIIAIILIALYAITIFVKKAENERKEQTAEK